MTGPDPSTAVRTGGALLVLAALATLALGMVATAPAVADATTAPANNSTVHHEHPDEVAAESDDESLQRWLESRLADRLAESSLRLSEGEADAARELLGEEYQQQYRQYVEVAGDSGDEDRVERLNETRANQEQYIGAVEEYRRTYEAYQEARQNGRQARARELARELERLSAEIQQTGENVSESYEAIGEETGADTTGGVESVRNVTGNVTQQQVTVRSETFVETELVASTPDAEASFADPLTIEGRLTAANGSAIANQRVRFRVAEQTIGTETDERGAFAFTYAPTTLAVDASNVSVSYDPRPDSVYLASNASVPITVSQVEPTIEITDAPATVAFNETVRIRGSFGANGTGAARAPIVLFAGDERLATTVTGADGSFALRAALPASLLTGRQSVRVSMPLQGRALTSANETVELTVAETPTNVTAEAVQHGSRELTVSGVLSTRAGDAVADAEVTIEADGRVLGTARTGPDGRYETVIALPDDLLGREDEPLSVAATYDGEGTNLGSSRAAAVAPISGESAGSALDGIASAFDTNPWLLLVAAAGVGALIFGFVRWSRRQPTDEGDERATDAEVTEPTESPADISEREVAQSLLSLAQRQLAAGETERAVQTAYAAVRRQLVGRFESGSAYTHWELYDACRSGVVDAEQVDALEELVRAYERATFAAGSVDDDTADRSVSAMRRIVSGES